MLLGGLQGSGSVELCSPLHSPRGALVTLCLKIVKSGGQWGGEGISVTVLVKHALSPFLSVFVCGT